MTTAKFKQTMSQKYIPKNALIGIGFLLLVSGLILIKYNLSKKIFLNEGMQFGVVNKQPELSKLIPVETKIKILIDKSDYTLQIFAADTLVKTYPVVFGGNPIDDKLMEGDQCTPEGTFYSIDKYPHKTWTKFIWLNYPTSDSWKKHHQAKQEGKIPKNAKIGSEIGIHGVPEGRDFAIDKRINWTLGCISLKNSDVNEIYPFIDKKTAIKIQK